MTAKPTDIVMFRRVVEHFRAKNDGIALSACDYVVQSIANAFADRIRVSIDLRREEAPNRRAPALGYALAHVEHYLEETEAPSELRVWPAAFGDDSSGERLRAFCLAVAGDQPKAGAS